MPRRPMVLLALLLPALAAVAGEDPPPAPPKADPPRAPAAAEDPQEKAYRLQIARARDLAVRALKSSDVSTAREAFDAFLVASRLRPKDPVPLAEAGLLALDMGDGGSAAAMLAAVHEAAPTSSAYHFLRGSVLQVRGEYADARMEYQAAVGGDFKATQAEDRLFECTVGYGFQLIEAMKFDEAIDLLKKSLELRPRHPLIPRVHLNIAQAYRRLQTNREAEKFLVECVEKYPAYAPAYGELGSLYTDTDRFDEALSLLDRAVKIDPGYGRAWILRANAQTARGKLSEAEQSFKEFDRRFPADAESEFYRGIFHQKRMEPEQAIERYRRCLALNPTYIRCLYFLSQCFRDLDQEDKAREYLEKWNKAEEAMRAQHGKKVGAARDRVGEKGPGEAKPGERPPETPPEEKKPDPAPVPPEKGGG